MRLKLTHPSVGMAPLGMQTYIFIKHIPVFWKSNLNYIRLIYGTAFKIIIICKGIILVAYIHIHVNDLYSNYNTKHVDIIWYNKLNLLLYVGNIKITRVRTVMHSLITAWLTDHEMNPHLSKIKKQTLLIEVKLNSWFKFIHLSIEMLKQETVAYMSRARHWSHDRTLWTGSGRQRMRTETNQIWNEQTVCRAPSGIG